MLRERMDEYLDGNLDAAAARDLEAVVAQDAGAAKLLSQVKAERALRTAAYDSYKPTRQEAAALSTRVLDDAYHTPLGRVGYWIRHGSAVAAAVLVVAGSYLAGYMTAPREARMREVRVLEPTHEARTVYKVVTTDARGQVTGVSDDLHSMEERDAYLGRWEAPRGMSPGDLMGRYRF
jgi:anti-sigma factor RsiW